MTPLPKFRLIARETLTRDGKEYQAGDEFTVAGEDAAIALIEVRSARAKSPADLVLLVEHHAREHPLYTAPVRAER